MILISSASEIGSFVTMLWAILLSTISMAKFLNGIMTLLHLIMPWNLMMTFCVMMLEVEVKQGIAGASMKTNCGASE